MIWLQFKSISSIKILRLFLAQYSHWKSVTVWTLSSFIPLERKFKIKFNWKFVKYKDLQEVKGKLFKVIVSRQSIWCNIRNDVKIKINHIFVSYQIIASKMTRNGVKIIWKFICVGLTWILSELPSYHRLLKALNLLFLILEVTIHI